MIKEKDEPYISKLAQLLKHSWETISNCGTSDIDNNRLKRKIIICNQLAFTVSILPIFTSLYLLIIVESPIFFTPFLVGLFYMSTILLNKFKLHTFSRIYLTILPTINLMIVSGFLSDRYSLSMKIPYISIIVAPIILFDLTEKRKLIFGIIWVVFMYFLTDIINPYIPILSNYDPAMINNLKMIDFSSVICFIIFISGFLYLQTINYNAEEKLIQLNTETERQKTELEVKNKTITDSIHYAKEIQNAALPKQQILNPYCSESFILYKPKDIISGDFFMFNVVEDHLIITVADCTGHGIPGALMSMLGISFLSESIRKPGLQKPNEILNNIRQQIKDALKQHDFSTKAKDGIDMAIVEINAISKKAEFSGANRPLYLFKKDDPQTLIEYKPNKIPLGIHTRETNFTSFEFQIEKGDTLYLFSDGYEDQFNDDGTKKMRSKTFKEQLVSIQNKSMKAQCEELEQLHTQWKGDEPQTDDILIVGIRF